MIAAGRRTNKQFLLAVVLAVAFIVLYWTYGYLMGTMGQLAKTVGRAPTTTTAPAGARAVLSAVPRPQGSSMLFAALRACMQQQGLRCDYDYLVGASGAGFRRAFRADSPGDDPRLFGPEPLRRACWILAIDDQLVPQQPAALRAAVCEAINAGRPAIAFGWTGSRQAGVITGYEQDGNVLIGYAPEQGDDQPAQVWEGWIDAVQKTPDAGLLLPGVHRGRFPPEREVLATALKYGIDLERKAKRPELPGYACGLEGSRAWAAMLEDASLFPSDKPEVMKLRAQVHLSQVAVLRDRAGAAYFLRQSSTSTPESMDSLALAANLLDEAAGHAMNLVRNDLEAALANRDTRALFAQEIRAAGAAELKAVIQLEKALAVPPQLPQRGQIRTPTPSEMTRGAKWQIEATPIPIAFRAAMDVLGEDFGRSIREGFSTNDAYTLFAGACGDAFLTGINITVEDQRLDIFRRFTASEREMAYRRALEAAGYSGDVFVRPDSSDSSASFTFDTLRRRIAQAISIDACPVIMHGLSGPERYTVVTGYEQDAAALYGWSGGGRSSSILFEPEKLEKYRDWFGHVDSVVVIGQRQEQRDERAIYLRALQRGVELLQRREDGGYHAGPALYEVWAKPFDRGYPIGTGGVKELQGLLDPVIWDLAERRHTTQRFMELSARVLPEAKTELLAAAADFRSIHDLMWKINELGGEKYEKVAEPSVRLQIARLIREAQQHDANAAKQIEAAIARVGAPIQ